MKPNTVNLYFLVDSSNYMLAKQSIFADKFADIINQYRQQVHLEVTVSLSIFSDDYKPVFWEKPLNEIELFTLEIHGQSSLLESACKMIDEVGKKLAEKQKKNDQRKLYLLH